MPLDQRPRIADWNSFTDIFEEIAVDQDTGASHTCTKFIVIDKDSEAFIGSVPTPKLDVTLDKAAGSLRRIPDVEIYPAVTRQMSVYALQGDIDGVYIKRPKVASHPWYAGSTTLADRFRVEAQTHELVRRNPHANIVHFEGCIVRNNLVVGLALRRYPRDLMTLVEDEYEDVCPPSALIHQWLRDIRAAVDQLHGLQLAHNDLNPRNIMQDARGAMVLVDLGSCAPLGARLTELGTPEWNEGFAEVSSVRNDEIGLVKIGEWLRGPR
ncbi:hypothetical protein LTR53_006208 [Teratosphaeriaceae sp. CCFEE 6253]|nr:hypothetical protein LTR53_006208 [Teratosphaeriaceae sp. CCFEE 6253]